MVIFSLSTSVAFADDSKTRNSIYPIIVSAMDDIVKGKLKEGIRKVTPYTVDPKIHTSATVDKFVAKRNKFNNRYGKSLGYTLAKTESIGQNVIKYLFLESLNLVFCSMIRQLLPMPVVRQQEQGSFSSQTLV